MTLERRPDGSVFIFHRGRHYRREPGSNRRWLKRKVNGWREVSEHRARRLEVAYQHRDELKKVLRFPREEPDLTLGQPVYCSAFGSGKIVAIKGDNITVTFGEQERRVDAQDLMTRAQSEMYWHAYWFSGAKRRFEEGKRLAIVKGLCRFGEWQAFLNKYDYPRSTADDLIRLYENEMKWHPRHLPGNRANEVTELDRHGSDSTSDSDAEGRKESVRLETEKRCGRKPSDHATDWTVRIKLPPRILALCREKYITPGAKECWRAAAYKFVGLDPRARHRKTSPQDASILRPTKTAKQSRKGT